MTNKLKKLLATMGMSNMPPHSLRHVAYPHVSHHDKTQRYDNRINSGIFRSKLYNQILFTIDE